MVPGVDVVRPADAGETAAVWGRIASEPLGPTCLVLSRQDLPALAVDTSDAARGAYVVRHAKDPMCHCSRLGLKCTSRSRRQMIEDPDRWARGRLGVQRHLGTGGLHALTGWFEQQPQAYQDDVLPPRVRARVSVEAAVEGAWSRWVGGEGVSVAVRDFGVSGDGTEVMKLRGITVQHTVSAAIESIHSAPPVPSAVPKQTSRAASRPHSPPARRSPFHRT